MTECSQDSFAFAPAFRREVVARFDAGPVSSDGGALLLREVAEKIHLLPRLAACFIDGREPGRIEHTVEQLLAQRLYALALGYEDLNDHDRLRFDPLLALLTGKREPEEESLASKSTLNRLELTRPSAETPAHRYQKILFDPSAADQLLLQLFVEAHPKPPQEIVLDLDATDDPLHGKQEGRFFHGYYGHSCYLPLYIFCGDHLLCARLRTADGDASAGALGEAKRIVSSLRQHWPGIRIILRADSGFCREEMMHWCEDHQVDYVFVSTHWLWSNQLRLYLSAFAYVLVDSLRRLALPGTALVQAEVNTIRLRLRKIGALVRVSVRRVRVSLSRAHPAARVFAQAWQALRC